MATLYVITSYSIHYTKLYEAKKILRNIEGISFVQFNTKDIVRHRLVRDIVEAYDKHYQKQLAKLEERKPQNKLEENE